MEPELQDKSITNQQKKIREWAKENGVNTVREFSGFRTTAAREPLRCAIYTRTDVAAQIDETQTQREATLAFIASRSGWTCTGMYEDIGHSGSGLNQPALRRLLVDVEASEVDCVVVHTLDRLTRSLADLAKLIAEFRRCEVILVIAHPVNSLLGGNKAGDASPGAS